MNWSVDNLEVLVAFDNIRTERKGLDSVEINLIHFGTDDFDKVLIAFEFHFFHTANLVDVVDSVLIVRRCHLSTVVPISFVSVIFLRIVRCGDDYTTLATKFADSKRHFRSWSAVIEEIYLNAISREDVCYDFSKQTAVVSHVVSYNHLNLFEVFKGIL